MAFEDDMYLKLLSILREQKDKTPSYYISSSRLRSLSGMTLEELRPYINDLHFFGYVDMETWFTDTFLVRITKKGTEAIDSNTIDIREKVEGIGEEKLEILRILQSEEDLGTPYYVPGKIITESLGISETMAYRLAKELVYAGFAKKIESTYPHFTLKITDKGIQFLETINKKRMEANW